MDQTEKQKVVVVTGSAGFIGFHVAKRLLLDGWKVVGIDCMSDYYDVTLKESRQNVLHQYSSYHAITEKIEKSNLLMRVFEKEEPNAVIHLAAQAGVRFSIESPRGYVESNLLGTFELLEAARAFPPSHLLMASTSSAYGANSNIPNKEIDKSDHQLSFYAATKKSTENMAHSYAHLFDIPTTMFRFFTVYGPWGRPDMALFKFTDAILRGEPIEIFNYGEMTRDFTYIDDLVETITRLISVPPLYHAVEIGHQNVVDSKSTVAPFRVVNIGNSKPEKLMDYISQLEKTIGIDAEKIFLPMQAGDVPATWADTKLAEALTGYKASTNIEVGIQKFIEWYREYYNV